MSDRMPAHHVTVGATHISSHPNTRANTIVDLIAGDNEPWMGTAVCAQTDPEAFFPEKGGSTRHAKAVCYTCDVRPECLEYALDHQERYGIWGGFSERERRKLQRDPNARQLILSTLRGIVHNDPPEPGEPQPEKSTSMPNNLDRKLAQLEATTMPPDDLRELSRLLQATENHPDPLVRAVRKITIQAGLALRIAATSYTEPLPTSDPAETPTDSHNDKTDPTVKPLTPSAPPAGSEPPKPPRGSRPGERAVPDPGAIREWAADNNIDCNPVGPIPRRVRMLYEARATPR